jgi:hypothetical protein
MPSLLFAGSVRSLAVNPQAPVLASVGLDRYLRLHSVHSRQLLAKVYLKTLPTGALHCPPPVPASCRCLLPASIDCADCGCTAEQQQRSRVCLSGFPCSGL